MPEQTADQSPPPTLVSVATVTSPSLAVLPGGVHHQLRGRDARTGARAGPDGA